MGNTEYTKLLKEVADLEKSTGADLIVSNPQYSKVAIKPILVMLDIKFILVLNNALLIRLKRFILIIWIRMVIVKLLLIIEIV